MPGLIERPARFLEQQVDEVIPGFGFGVVVCVGLRRRGHLRRGNFGADALQLLVEQRALGKHDGQLLVALAKRGLDLLELFRGLSR